MKITSNTSKTVAILSQSSHRGGAESALLNLLATIINLNHKVVAIFPDSKGPLIKDVEKTAARIEIVPLTKMLSDPANTALFLSNGSYEGLKRILSQHGVDLVVTNTLAVFDGALAAAALDIPHIWSVHEIIERSPEFSSASVARNTYSAWLNELSDHIIYCSKATRDSYVVNGSLCESSILAPYRSKARIHDPRQLKASSDGVVNLYVIGAATERKNPSFAIEVVKSLTMRGKKVQLFFIGAKHERLGALDFLVRRRDLNDKVTYVGHVSDPYSYVFGLAINLVCASCEPFGLTIPESLARGIPVVAPNIDGPSELLNSASLFEENSVADCVRIIEVIASNYNKSSIEALSNYEKISQYFKEDYQTELISASIEKALKSHRVKSMPKEFEMKYFGMAVQNDHISEDFLISNVMEATSSTRADIIDAIEREREQPGSAVWSDVKKFDIIPFQHSKEMDCLYKYGDGFYIELLANIGDPARLKMASFIILRLLTESRRVGSGLKVLAIGDGIGLDSMRIASAGFDVDYMDVEFSVTSAVAAKNFEKFQKSAKDHCGRINIVDLNYAKGVQYDAVVSLEVIEHVDDPVGFFDFISKCLGENGLLFISECFNGVMNIYPTHLSKNERLSGLLPLFASTSGLVMEGYAMSPLYKPYVFRKPKDSSTAMITSSILMSPFVDIIIKEQSKVKSSKLNGISFVVSCFRAYKHYLKRHLVKIIVTMRWGCYVKRSVNIRKYRNGGVG